MILEGNDKLVFLGVETRQGKNGDFQLVKLGDPINYVNYDFFKRDDLNVTGIEKGQTVTVTLEMSVRGFNKQVDLIRMTPVK